MALDTQVPLSADRAGGRPEPAEISEARRDAFAGRLDEAFMRLVALTKGPQAPLAFKVMGDILARRHLDVDAAENYEQAIRLDSEYAEAHNNLANVLWRRSKDVRAVDHYARAIELNPGYGLARANLALVKAEAGSIESAVALIDAVPADQRSATMWRTLAMVLRQANQLEEALDAAHRALSLDAGDSESLAVAAGILRAKGDVAAALDMARRAIEANPAGYVGYAEASLCLAAAGERSEALACARHAVEVAPGNARAYDALGRQLLSTGRVEEATLFLKHAVKLDPNYVLAWFHLGVAFEKSEQLQDAMGAQDEVLKRRPDYAPASVCRAGVLVAMGRSKEAETALRDLIAKDPLNAMAWSNLSRALEDLGRYEEAAEAALRAVEIAPELPEPHVNYGIARQVLGDLRGAQAAFRKALSLNPELVPALFSLVATDAEHAEDLLDGMTALRDRDDLSEEQRSQLHFALARIYDLSGDYDRAFEEATKGNRLQRQRSPYDRAQQEQFTSAIESVFDSEFFAKRTTFGSTSNKPIFIVGLPRSGTTLVEQILASHSSVYGAGELTKIPVLAHSIPEYVHSQEHFPASARDLDEPGVLRLASAYLRSLREVAGKARRVTDKMPSNYFYLGLIALMFPRAAIVACERDPFDTFVSGYLVRFRRAIAHTENQADFAHFHSLYRRLLAHWRDVLPGRVLTVAYERLVADQEAETRRLLAHCGLDWEDGCLRFHETRRPVRTASSTQVRRPLFSTSVGRAQPYLGHLGELRHLLGNQSAHQQGDVIGE